MSKYQECNFDGLIGPTHSFAGLAYGNLASHQHAKTVANPKLAAKQGLAKMQLLAELGVPQYILPPHSRPNFGLLHSLGFNGTPEQVLDSASQRAPDLLQASYSASSMWTANMATVSASTNSVDKGLHLTPANLQFNLHRAQEADFSYQLLAKVFADEQYFTVHKPLLASRQLSDEGAANHSAMCLDYNSTGLEIFCYGQSGKVFHSRQSKLASAAIARLHNLIDNNYLLVEQSAEALDAGAFHNDVLFVANKNVVFCHQQALLNWSEHKVSIQQFFNNDCYILDIASEDLELDAAVQTYIFNSQLVSIDNDNMCLIAPIQVQRNDNTRAIVQRIIAEQNPITKVKYVDLTQSMNNGGGPACLRLRINMNESEQQAMSYDLKLDDAKYTQLNSWIDKHYRDSLSVEDFADPLLYKESHSALDELTQILGLGSIYDFQMNDT